MGCGTSSAGAMSSVDKHPTDAFLPHVHLQRLKIAKFDDYFAKFETPANSVIKLSNSLAGTLFGIKQSTCALMGGLHVKLTAGTDHDIVLLQFAKTDGTVPATDEVILLQKKPEVKAADAKLAAALEKLAGSTPTGLTVSPADGLEGQAEFNEALKAFKTAVGAGYATKVVLKSASAVGAPTVVAAVTKPEFKGSHENAHYVPATLLDIAATKAAKEVFAAQVGVAEQVHALAAASKDLSIAYEVHENRVNEPTSAEVEDAAKLEAIEKAVTTFNIQSYKLIHAGFNANGEVSLAAAVVAVVSGLRKHAETLAKDAGKDAMAAIPTVVPKFEVKDDMSFDFDLDVKMGDMPELPQFPEVLPPPARHVWEMVKGLQGKVTGLIEQFAPLKDELTAMIDASKTVFDDAASTIQEAGLAMGDAMKAPGIIKKNLTAITGMSATFASISLMLKSVVDELKQSFEDIKKVVA